MSAMPNLSDDLSTSHSPPRTEALDQDAARAGLRLLRNELACHRMEIEFLHENGYLVDEFLLGETVRLSKRTRAFRG